MSGHIEHWDRRYRVRHPAASGRLDALAGAVLAASGEAVGDALADPDEVVLVRGLDVRLVLTPAYDSDAELARAWGRAMATGVLRALADKESPDVARFADPADHAASFLIAAVEGRGTDHWSFERFAPARRTTVSDTVASVLLADPDSIPAVLRRLHRSGSLPRVVAVLGPLAGRIWREAVAGGTELPDADRPLFAAALAFVERLGSRQYSAAAAAARFAEFATGPHPATDWRDRTHLAEAVAVAARFLIARDPISPPPTPSAVGTAADALDWLDVDWLARRTAAIFETPVAAACASITRPPLSGRRGEWIEALRRLIPRIADRFDRGDLKSPSNLLQAFAALMAERPEWADDPTVPGFIEVFFAAAEESIRSRPSASAAVHAVEAMGPPAVELVRAIVGRSEPRATVASADGFRTEAAGVFLLLRTLRDLRLLALARRSGFPSADDNGQRRFAAALATRLSGLTIDSEPDPGLLAFAGLSVPFDVAEFRAAWESTPADSCERFQHGLARILVGQRFLDAEQALTRAVVPVPSGWAAFTGCDSEQLWPFAAPVDSPDADPGDELWRAGWESFTGCTSVVRPLGEPIVLASAAEALAGASFGNPHAEATLAASAICVVRAWARWLRGLNRTSVPYLLGQFLRRPGRISSDGRGLLVALEPRPLDVALQMAGYLEPIDALPGSDAPTVRFRIGGDI